MLSVLNLSSSASGNVWEHDLANFRGKRRRDFHIMELNIVRDFYNCCWRNRIRTTPTNSQFYTQTIKEIDRDIRFLTVVNNMTPYIFKRVFGVVNRSTHQTKCQDSVIIQAVYKKRLLMDDIPFVARKFFERRLTKRLALSTGLCMDLIASIASFA